MNTLIKKLWAAMPKPDELPTGPAGDLFKEGLICLDTLTGWRLTKQLSEISPLLYGTVTNDLELALFKSVVHNTRTS